MNVYFTVDTELWPDSWQGFRTRFRESFDRYILGKTAAGSYGLEFQLRMIHEHDLQFVFFVETLFSCEGGLAPLKDIVAMVDRYGQEIQLHAHPEWVNHMETPFVETGGRYLFDEFSTDEQTALILKARERLEQAGGGTASAFRAGSFAANLSTLNAVANNGIRIDSSLKLSENADDSYRSWAIEEDVLEYPLTVFHDWPGSHTRPLQLAACSYDEIAYVLDKAYEAGWDSIVILSHSAELLAASRSRPNRLTVRRFERVCRLLADNRDKYTTRGFRGVDTQPNLIRERIRSTVPRTLYRVGEQFVGRILP